MTDEDLARTRAAYDAVAVDYARLLVDHLDGQPIERALLAVFAESVLAAGGGVVGDLGCGPGRITGPLHALGLDVFGLDLSPAMVEEARRRHPAIDFRVGSLTDLALPDAALAGAVAWYSIIHTPEHRLDVVCAELHRTLAPGGLLLLAFQAGHEVVQLTHAYGHDLDLDAHRLDPDHVAARLVAAGLVERSRTLRRAEGDEPTDQAYLLFQRPVT